MWRNLEILISSEFSYPFRLFYLSFYVSFSDMCVQFIPAAALVDYVLFLVNLFTRDFCNSNISLHGICPRHVVRGRIFSVVRLICTLCDDDSREYVNGAFILSGLRLLSTVLNINSIWETVNLPFSFLPVRMHKASVLREWDVPRSCCWCLSQAVLLHMLIIIQL